MSAKPDPIEARLAALPEPDLTDPDNPEWTEADFARARPAADILPDDVMAAFPKTRRPGDRGAQKTPKKRPVTIRLDPAVVEHFKATGPRWQSRINDALVGLIGKAP